MHHFKNIDFLATCDIIHNSKPEEHSALPFSNQKIQFMENELSPEILAFWNKVKYHLCGNGLLDVAETYPQLRFDAERIRAHRPEAINYATRSGDMMVGSKVNYIGALWKEIVGDQKVTFAKTPMAVAVYGEACFECGGHILTCKSYELRFDHELK